MDDNYLELEENLNISNIKNKWINFFSEHILNNIKKIVDNNKSEIDDAIYQYATEQISDQYDANDLHRPDKMQIIDEFRELYEDTDEYEQLSISYIDDFEMLFNDSLEDLDEGIGYSFDDTSTEFIEIVINQETSILSINDWENILDIAKSNVFKKLKEYYKDL
tara:strand:- start:199 stop:690 length:492 start_codon:yes stop_codon:yes gene_type:complete